MHDARHYNLGFLVELGLRGKEKDDRTYIHLTATVSILKQTTGWMTDKAGLGVKFSGGAFA